MIVSLIATPMAGYATNIVSDGFIDAALLDDAPCDGRIIG